MKSLFVFAALIAFSACAKKEIAVHSPTALVAVIADPVRFHGKTVRVSGFFRRGFETSGLFPSRDLSFSEANGLWLDWKREAMIEPLPSDPIWRDMKPLWLEVEGVVDAEQHGHLGAWTGAIHATKIKANPVDWLDDRTR
ncbi:MAG TPA: hypothetical protein VHC20_08080 [Candidatus Paceibacterota bacterium]|nr:hypothetical protein [Candidatus Paceibacterota bacterium]